MQELLAASTGLEDSPLQSHISQLTATWQQTSNAVSDLVEPDSSPSINLGTDVGGSSTSEARGGSGSAAGCVASIGVDDDDQDEEGLAIDTESTLNEFIENALDDVAIPESPSWR